eukprot:COSAG01_NODE_492_length_16335_cov_63.722284_12_plen_56_part_00
MGLRGVGRAGVEGAITDKPPPGEEPSRGRCAVATPPPASADGLLAHVFVAASTAW